MNKKIAGFLFSFAAMVSLIACSGSGTGTGEQQSQATVPEPTAVESAVETPTPEITEAASGNIYLILPTEIGLSAQEEAAVMSAAKQAGYQVTVMTSEGDASKQTAAFDAAIEAKASVIICDNADNDATTASIQKAKQAGISTVLMNRGISDQGIAAAQILTDRKACFKRLAETFADQMGKTGSYAYIYTSADADMSSEIQAFSEEMKSYDSMTEAGKVDADASNREAVKETIRQLLAEKPEISALVCANSIQAHAASDIVEEQSIELTIVCLDGNDDKISTAILSGKMYASIVKPAESLANTAVADAIACIKNGTTGTTECMYYPGVILTQRETILVASPTPAPEASGTPSPIPSGTASPDDSSLAEIELEDSDNPGSGADNSGDTYSSDTGNGQEPGDFDVEIIDEEYDEGGEGRPEMVE